MSETPWSTTLTDCEGLRWCFSSVDDHWIWVRRYEDTQERTQLPKALLSQIPIPDDMAGHTTAEWLESAAQYWINSRNFVIGQLRRVSGSERPKIKIRGVLSETHWLNITPEQDAMIRSVLLGEL